MSALAHPRPIAAPASLLPLSMYRFTVKQYHGMIEAGVLNGDDRCELLEGWIIAKMSQNPPYAATITRINRCLQRLVPDGWTVRSQCPVTLKDSEPEPDVAVARGSADAYDKHHPRPKEIVMLVEVADSSLISDRGIKGPMYARAGVPIYWIANLIDMCMEVYTEPKAGKAPWYCSRRDYAVGESVPLVLNGHEIDRIPVRDLLP